MTYDELKSQFPNASESFLRANADNNSARIRPANPQRIEGRPLERPVTGQETRWHFPAERFQITFTVFATSPADWDNYSIKYLQDWLVAAGIIPGDGWKTLSGRVLPVKVHTKEEERTEIEIAIIDKLKEQE